MPESFAFLSNHVYLVLVLWVFAEQIGLPIPSTPILLAAGAFAQTGRANFAVAVFLASLSAMTANHCWYEIGRWRGNRVLNLLCRISLEPDYCVRRTENTFAKQGPRALLVAKFVPGISALATPMAGVNRMPRPHFFGFNALGTLLWIGSFEAVGYVFSQQLAQVMAAISQVGGALFAVVASGLIGYIGWKYTQRRLFLRRLRIARITPDELKQQMDAGENVFIVDLRHETEFTAEPRTLPGALRMGPEEIEQRAIEIPRHHAIVLFCT